MITLRRILIFVCVFALAACEPSPADPNAIPTILVLPTETATIAASPITPEAGKADTLAPELTATSEASETSEARPTLIAEVTIAPSASASSLPIAQSPTASATGILTQIPAVTERPSLTPSMTITDTPTRTPTVTPYTDEDLSPLFQLAIVALSSTPPPTGFYVPPTLTPTGFAPISPANPGVPGAPGGTLCLPPPGGFGSIFAADPTLSTQIGCPLGSTLTYAAAIQTFERGMMIYVGSSPSAIYVLYNTGTYTRFADTWIDGVDPISGGEVAPSGLYEPIRGFGKVWRNDMTVRNGLGWATQPEAGTNVTLMLFQNGQMIALPTLGQVAVMTTIGTYRLVAGSA
jgi:hypothetical protein